MLVLKPNIAILDEPDSGLAIDAVKAVAEAINKLIATGKVIKSGGKELAEELEAKGYGWLGIEEDK